MSIHKYNIFLNQYFTIHILFTIMNNWAIKRGLWILILDNEKMIHVRLHEFWGRSGWEGDVGKRGRQDQKPRFFRRKIPKSRPTCGSVKKASKHLLTTKRFIHFLYKIKCKPNLGFLVDISFLYVRRIFPIYTFFLYQIFATRINQTQGYFYYMRTQARRYLSTSQQNVNHKSRARFTIQT